jgi:hypothetical protein
VWIAGIGKTSAFILHWNGKAWIRVASGAPQDTALWGMAMLSGTSAWVVGADTHGRPSLGGANDTAVILHWNGKAWS